jgi:O-6-methylguanine DNA methyltransferase
MRYGYARLSSKGPGQYVCVAGDDAITSITMEHTQELLGDGDPTMHGYAAQVLRWIREGLPFTAPVRLEVTPFQQAVFSRLMTVPAGKVTTYKALGDAVGSNSYRAVGQALRTNPVPFLVPCHRVVKSDRTVGGYAFGPELKEHILKKEGVAFDGNTVKEQCLLREL